MKRDMEEIQTDDLADLIIWRARNWADRAPDEGYLEDIDMKLAAIKASDQALALIIRLASEIREFNAQILDWAETHRAEIEAQYDPQRGEGREESQKG